MMKRFAICVVACCLVMPIGAWAADEAGAKAAPTTQPAGDSVLKTDKEKVSYSIGMNIAEGMKARDIDIDVDLLAQAMKDVLAGKATLLTEDQARQTLMAWQMQQRQAYAEKQKALGEKNAAEGKAFLEANAKKEGVKTTASGLQYQIIKPGEGDGPKETDMVAVHYRGTLIDGKEFDSSYKRGQPATFEVNGVIPGWTEALKMMKPGAEWKLVIPAELAYGARGQGADIGPNATLVFEVKLLSVKPTATGKPQPMQATPMTQPK